MSSAVDRSKRIGDVDKAYELSRRATSLLSSASPKDASDAVSLLEEAATLFERAAKQSQAEGGGESGVTSETLQLLAAQHRRRAKDARRQAARPAASVRTASAVAMAAPEDGSNDRHSAAAAATATRSIQDVQSRKASDARTGTSNQARIDATTSRRRLMQDQTSKTTTAAQQPPPFARAKPPISSSHSHPTSDVAVGRGVGSGMEDGSTASMQGSSSSSEKGGESYVVWGDNLDSSDPFARFWSKLETAFDEISKPIAFTSMPLDIPKPQPSTHARPKSLQRETKSSHSQAQQQRQAPPAPPPPELSPSSSGSFCVILDEDPDAPVPAPDHDTSSYPRPHHPNQKTAEELELENASLKTGLDAMSHHAQLLANELKAIRAKEEKRGELMKSVVLGVRMEAQRAMQSQELRMSQMLSPSAGFPGRKAATAAPVPAAAPTQMTTVSTSKRDERASSEDEDALRLRILELEGQLLSVQSDNERMRGQLQKYKDRFERIRTSARAKREAKLLAAGNVPSTPLATLGEEDNEA